jgi:hypothetical protein
MTKTYWQAMDNDGKAYLFHGDEKPTCDDGEYYSDNNGNYSSDFLFPIELKPLQIAEVKVNENGTWSWEIEREEGWYAAEYADKKGLINRGKTIFIEYKGGAWFYPSRSTVGSFDMAQLTISSIRIPDECII